MKKKPKELPIPPAAIKDSKSCEMVRAWIANRGLHITLNIGHWEKGGGIEEDKAWGILLADAVRHIANAMEESEGIDRLETIRRIRKSFETELDSPTSETKGHFA